MEHLAQVNIHVHSGLTKLSAYDLEPLTFFTNEGIRRNAIVNKEDLIRIDTSAAHFLDRSEMQARCVFVKINEE